MQFVRSTARLIVACLALGSIALLSEPARPGEPAPPPAAALRAAVPSRPLDAAGRKAELDARVHERIRSLSARVRALSDGTERAALLAEMSGALRRHRVARLEIDLEAARARSDRRDIERIERILDRLVRPRAGAAASGAARDPRREVPER